MKKINRTLRLAVCLTCLLCVGCGPISGRKIDAAKMACGDSGIKLLYSSVDRVVCNNGLDINLHLNDKDT